MTPHSESEDVNPRPCWEGLGSGFVTHELVLLNRRVSWLDAAVSELDRNVENVCVCVHGQGNMDMQPKQPSDHVLCSVKRLD